jgi:4-alpha-glucanotransferase
MHKLNYENWKRKMESMKRASGVLLHITSLPNDYTLGTFSCECNNFIDWLSDAGFGVWQILPITDCGYAYSPYSAMSSFAINPCLIDLTQFLSKEELQAFGFDKSQDRLTEESKIMSAIDLIYEKFGKTTDKTEFEKKNKAWLDDYAIYKVIKKLHNNVSWKEFPTTLKNRDKVALDSFIRKNRKEIDKVKFVQFIASEQWNAIKNYASSKNVQIFGDIPFYAEMDSCDVWSNPKNWKLGESGKGEIAGVPPDYFNADGQLWGNPIYNFTAMAKNKYKYFVDRFLRQSQLFDIIRIDHFIAFSRYWSVPAGSTTAKNGKWVKGSGDTVLKEITSKVKSLIIAEDLGIVTPEATALREKFGIPGLKVMQFAFDGDGDNMYQPHNYEKNCVAYLGTHDNDTLMGLLNNSDWDKINRFKRYFRIPLEWGNDAVVDNAILSLYRSSANLIILTLQDILKLGSECRMNVPGVIEGCWTWQLDRQPSKELCASYAELSHLYARHN